jgi:hypothetical protein
LYFVITRESRIDRIAGIFPVLISSGAIFLEKLLSKKYFIWLKFVIIIFIIISGACAVPLYLPVLKPEKAVEYFLKYGYKNEWACGVSGKLETTLAGRMGWEEFVKKVADIYNSLPVEQKKHTGIFCPHYSYAGAIDLLGKKYNLPDSISGSNNYFLWSKKRLNNFDQYIFIDTSLISNYDAFEMVFTDIRLAGIVSNEYLPGFMQKTLIFTSGKPKVKFEDMWHSFKFFM